MALTRYTGTWTNVQVSHLLKRTMFGATKKDIRYFTGRSMDQAVDELLNPTAPFSLPPIKDYTVSAPGDPDNAIAKGQTWVGNNTETIDVEVVRRVSFRTWYMGVLLNQDRSIREKLTLFWHNHFATESEVIFNANFVYRHHDLLRKQALGNVKAFVKAITIDAGMLVYLNGKLNSKSAPDENYARELQELFTLGKENDPNYNEDDVRAAARVLTGWRIDDKTEQVYFDPNEHDTGNKTFSSFYGNKVITGRSGPDAGEQELNELLDMIFTKRSEVSNFIVRKLYRWFVFSNIPAAVQQDVIDPLADMLVANNWEIKPVLRALFTSDHFYTASNIGSQIKSPIDFVVGLCRECGNPMPPFTDMLNAYKAWTLFGNTAMKLMQQPGEPPDVAGWKAYYQKPFYYQIWINSDTYPRRLKFTDTMAEDANLMEESVPVDRVAFIRTLDNPSDPDMLIRELITLFYQTELSKGSIDQIRKDILLGGQDNNYYWTELWTSHISNPGDMTTANLVNEKLRDLLKYLMSLPEYQLM